MKFLVVIEPGSLGWGAHVPDLPGCVAAAETRDKTLELILEAIRFHIEGMQEHGEMVPEAHSEGLVVEVHAA
ncbi:MAG: type II toxin-antitoxin system HicB family antitoxin [Candidatus Zixiibacteriota bacterium]